MMKPLFDTSLLEKTDEQLSDSLYAIVQYIPLLSTLVGIGFLTIYVLARFGILGNPAWQLLAVTGVILFVTVSHLQVIRWTRSQQLLLAYALYSLAMAATSMLFVLFWQGIFVVAFLIAWIVPLSLFAIRSRRLHLVLGVSISAITTIIIMGLDGNPSFARLSIANPAGFSALILLASTVVLFIFTAIISRLLQYRTLQNRLVVSFIFIIAVPVLFITVISVFNAFTNSQNQFRDTLQAISSLKQDEVDATIQRAFIDLSTLQIHYGLNQPSILYVVQHQGDNDQLFQANDARATLSLQDYLNSVQYRYEEALILNPAGKVLLSSYSADKGLSLGQETFF